MGRNYEDEYNQALEPGDLGTSDTTAPAASAPAPAGWKSGYEVLKKQMGALQDQTDIYKRRSPLDASTHIDNIATSLARDYGVNTIGDIGVREVIRPGYASGSDESYTWIPEEKVSEYFNKTTGKIIPGYRFASEGRGDGYSDYNLQPVQQADGSTIVLPIQQYSKSGMGSFVENLGPILPVVNLVAMAAGAPPLWMAAGNVALQYGAGNVDNIGDALKVAAPYLVAAGMQGLDMMGPSTASTTAGRIAESYGGLTGTAADIVGGALTEATGSGLAGGDIGTSALVGGLSPAISAGVKSAFSGIDDALSFNYGIDSNDSDVSLGYDWALDPDINSVNTTAQIAREQGLFPEDLGVDDATRAIEAANADDAAARAIEAANADAANVADIEAARAVEAANADDAAARAIEAANADAANVADIEAANAVPPAKDATKGNKLTPDNYANLITALIVGTITAKTFNEIISGDKPYNPADLATTAAPALTTVAAQGMQALPTSEARYWRQTGATGTGGKGGVRFFDWYDTPENRTMAPSTMEPTNAPALAAPVPEPTPAPAAKQYFNQETNRYYTDPTGTWQPPAGWNEVSKPLSRGGIVDNFDILSGIDLDISDLDLRGVNFNNLDLSDIELSNVNDYLRNLSSDNASYGNYDLTNYSNEGRAYTGGNAIDPAKGSPTNASSRTLSGSAKTVVDKLADLGVKLTENALKSITENPGTWLAALAGAGLGYAGRPKPVAPMGMQAGSLGLTQPQVYNALKGVPVKRAMGGEINGYAKGGGLHYLKSAEDGMADRIAATIDNKQPAKLSGGEFVIPADVVSHLGNGNSEAGAKQLYAMMDRIRHARTGTKKQGKQINPAKFTPK
jgi:hypothetical protein